MQSENRFFDDLAKMVNGIAGTVAGAGRETRRQARGETEGRPEKMSVTLAKPVLSACKAVEGAGVSTSCSTAPSRSRPSPG